MLSLGLLWTASIAWEVTEVKCQGEGGEVLSLGLLWTASIAWEVTEVRMSGGWW